MTYIGKVNINKSTLTFSYFQIFAEPRKI